MFPRNIIFQNFIIYRRPFCIISSLKTWLRELFRYHSWSFVRTGIAIFPSEGSATKSIPWMRMCRRHSFETPLDIRTIFHPLCSSIHRRPCFKNSFDFLVFVFRTWNSHVRYKMLSVANRRLEEYDLKEKRKHMWQ